MTGKSSLLGLAALLLCVGTAAASEYDEALGAMGEELAACMGRTGTQRVATVDFTDLQGNVSQLGRLVAEELSTELVRKALDRGYSVVDRNHLQVILAEYELDATGLLNPENSKKIGTFAGIDTLITGNIFELEDSIRITAKALNTETAAIRCASRGDADKTLALREAGAMAAGSRRLEDEPDRGATAPAPEALPVHQDEYVRVALRSIRKSRDGQTIQLVLAIQNRTENEIRLALDVDNPPALFDDLGGEWTFQRCTGIDSRQVEWDAFQFDSETPKSSFRPGVELPVSCAWRTAGEGSPASSFSFTSSLIAQVIEHYGSERDSGRTRIGGRTTTRTRPGRLFQLPVGLTDLRPR